MAIVFSDVSEDVALYGRMHTGTVEYIRDKVQNGMKRFSSRALDRYETMRNDVLRNVSIGDMQRKLDAASRITRSKFRGDAIRRLGDIGDLQNPPDQMLNYLGANPNFRQRYHANQCDGWSSRYVDDQPGVVGEDHYWYRRSTQGIRLRNVETGRLEMNVYFERLKDGDSELEVERQLEVLEAWDLLNQFIEIGRDDPTSKWNSQLN